VSARRQGTLRRALRLTSARIALGIILLIVVLAIFGGVLAPQNPLAQNTSAVLQGPSGAHWLGTDYLGRDVLSRLIAGTGRSVVGALEAVGIGLLLGVVPGLASLWLGRTYEWISLRIVDAFMTLPYVVFAVAVTGFFGNSLTAAMSAVGVLIAPLYFRVTRAAALGLNRTQYVEAAELFGSSRRRVLSTHLWNKILPTLAVTTAQALASALLIVSSLAFLGLGVEPPLPTWGELLSSDLDYLAQQPWAPLFPGLLIMLVAAALNAFADAIRDTGASEDLNAQDASDASDADAAEEEPGDEPSSVAGIAPVAEPVLRVDGLRVTVSGGRTEAVHGVSFEVGRGEIVGLVGESGSGKTLTCRAVTGLLAPGCARSAGTVELLGEGATPPVDLAALDRADWNKVRGTRIGVVFQDPASYLNPSIQVGRQLVEAIRAHSGLNRSEARRRAIELFASVGLREPETVYRQYPHELSGGMAQRVLIAIAISGDPDLLIADEATSALDVLVQAEVLDLLRGLVRDRGLALLLVTHDLAVVAELCDRVLVCDRGRIVEQGLAAQVVSAPAQPQTRRLLDAARVWQPGFDDVQTELVGADI
jgi:peptide/nickel transport system permease protein